MGGGQGLGLKVAVLPEIPALRHDSLHGQVLELPRQDRDRFVLPLVLQCPKRSGVGSSRLGCEPQSDPFVEYPGGGVHGLEED